MFRRRHGLMRSLDQQLISSIVAAGCAGVVMLFAAATPQDSTLQASDTQSAEREVKAEIGQPAPEFTLKDLDGNVHHLRDYKGKMIIIEWFDPECDEVTELHRHGSLSGYANKIHGEDDKVWLAVNSAQRDEPGWGVKVNKDAQNELKLDFPVLLDQEGEVARRYGAVRTPQVFVIDKEGVLRYRGAVDDDPGAKKVKAGQMVMNYVRNAIEAIEAGIEVVTPKTEPYGCKIKAVEKSRGGG